MLKVDLTKWPTLMAYMERMKALPSVQKAMKAEGLL
jgi:glutathione S-transferase